LFNGSDFPQLVNILQNKLLKMLESNKSREIHLGKQAMKWLGIKVKSGPLIL